MVPRGIRNNNPLNIRRSRVKWQGMKAQGLGFSKGELIPLFSEK